MRRPLARDERGAQSWKGPSDAVCPMGPRAVPDASWREDFMPSPNASLDSLKTRRDLSVGRKKYAYYSLKAAEEAGLSGISRLPRSMKVLLENLLRKEDGKSVALDDLRAVA